MPETGTRRILLIGLLAVLWGTGAGAVRAQEGPDWPQWRGPNRDGSVPAFAAPATWPDALSRQWSATVGEGYATPILVGDRLYVFARQGEDEVMLALDPATGTQLWRASYPAPFSFQPAAEPHGPGPKATPTFADGRLFTLGLGGVVTAFDSRDGTILWQKPAPATGPLYGTAASPLVDGDRVIVNVGGHDDGALTAFDVETGTVVWSWDGDGPSYASPFVAEVQGTRQVITLSQDSVIGVAARDGRLLWQRPFSTAFAQNIITPIVHRDLVIVSGFQEPVSAFRLVRQGSDWTTEDAWENGEASLYMANGILVGDGLFGLSQRNSGQYFLIDADTGETRWTGMGRQAENAAIVAAGDLLLVLQDDAQLLVGRVGAGGFEEIRRYDVADRATWAAPAISGNRIFVKDVTNVILWTIGPPVGAPGRR